LFIRRFTKLFLRRSDWRSADGAERSVFREAARHAGIALNGESGDPSFGGPKNLPMLAVGAILRSRRTRTAREASQDSFAQAVMSPWRSGLKSYKQIDTEITIWNIPG
jgi:hypothetical protein